VAALLQAPDDLFRAAYVAVSRRLDPIEYVHMLISLQAILRLSSENVLIDALQNPFGPVAVSA
jgi:hypothetical protein